MMPMRTAVMLVAVLGVTAPERALAASADAALVRRMQAGFDQANRGQCRESLDTLRPLMTGRAFAGLDDQNRLSVYWAATLCSSELNDAPSAYRYAVMATAIKGANEYVWHVRFGGEVNSKHYALAVATVEAMATQNPEAVNALKVKWLFSLDRKLREPPDRTLRRRLLATLSTSAYRPDEIDFGPDLFRRDYAAILADEGRKAEAFAIVATIEDVRTLMEISVDPRLRAALAADFDARAPTERQLGRWREVAASHPASLAAVLEVARHLRLLGRCEEALATLEAARPDGNAAAAFADLDEERNWWWNEKARANEALGRYDDAVTAFRTAIDLKEGGNLNVSQTINLAATQTQFGRHADALATLAVFDAGGHRTSPYGEMQFRSVRFCARMALGQADAASADLAYARAHDRDAPGTMTEMLLCAGDMDGAAASIIRRLDDPDQRTDALLDLSDYAAPLPAYPRSRDELRLPELKARADVLAAAKRAGGTRRFQVQQ